MIVPSPSQIADAIERRRPQGERLLGELISAPSLPGQEQAAMLCAERALAEICDVRKIPLSNELLKDPDYSDPIPDITYDGRWNLRALLPGTGNGDGRKLLLNAHLDTVPPSPGHIDPYIPIVREGKMYGRGACDDKGQVVIAYLVIAALKDLDVRLPGDLVAHFVVEEENGGNGTLAMVRTREQADGCVVLEPTELKILSSVRGAVWFRITLTGKAGHSGQAGVTQSALKMAVRVMEVLEGYHKRLLDASRGIPLFDLYDNPMPLTFGRLVSGNWPAAAPSDATMEGVLGLLPNKTASQVMQEMEQVIREECGTQIADNMRIHFMYRHDSSVCPTDHPLVQALSSGLTDAGLPSTIDAMTASCDSCFYSNHLGIPTVVFGGGSLSVAHSDHEHMPLDELTAAASALANFAVNWCGSNRS